MKCKDTFLGVVEVWLFMIWNANLNDQLYARSRL
jgi:hypothetical protein